MRAPPYLATARLRLRPRRHDDIDAILEMDLDPEVYRYYEMLPSFQKIPDPATLRESIGSSFVLLNLLKGKTQRLAQLLLAESDEISAHAQAL